MKRGFKYDFKDGKWMRLSWAATWDLACCDCCLVHHVERKLVKRGTGHELWIRMSRNEPETAALRKAMKKRVT